MMVRRLWALTLAVVLVMSACGGDSDADPATPDPDQTSDSTDDGGDGGSGTPPASGDLPDSVPEGFPIAIPSGWEVDLNGEIGLTVSAPRLLYPADAYADIVAFFDAWTDAQPDEYSRVETDDGVSFTGMANSPRLITVSRDHEERDATWTLLVASGSTDG